MKTSQIGLMNAPAAQAEEEVSHQAPPGARTASRLSVVAFALAIAAFVLPFTTISCFSARTEAMTGLDLALSRPPTIAEGTDPQDIADIEETAASLSLFAATTLILAILAATAGLWSVVAGTRGAGQAAMWAALFMLVGSSSLLPGPAAGPTVHHLYGYWLMLTCVASGVVAAFLGVRLRTELADRRRRDIWWPVAGIFSPALTPVGWILGPLVLYPVVTLIGTAAVLVRRPTVPALLGASMSGISCGVFAGLAAGLAA